MKDASQRSDEEPHRSVVPDPANRPQRPNGVERRRKPRLRAPFPVRVWGTDASGRQFELQSRSRDISAIGMCLDLPCEVDLGEQLLALVEFIRAPDPEDRETSHVRVAVWGPVVRSRRQKKTWETAVHFRGHVIA